MLHAIPLAASPTIPTRTLANELKVVVRASEHLQSLLPTIGSKVLRIVEQIQRAATDIAPEALVLAHKDYKADPLWLSMAGQADNHQPSQMILMDSDSCCQAEPAMDIGKLLADLA